jgi:hypothetical protein
MSGARHRRKDHRPIFVLRLRPEKGINPIHGLRHALKELLRRHGMRAVSVDDEQQPGQVRR